MHKMYVHMQLYSRQASFFAKLLDPTETHQAAKKILFSDKQWFLPPPPLCSPLKIKWPGSVVTVWTPACLFKHKFLFLLWALQLTAVPSAFKRSEYKLKKECSSDAYTQKLSKQKAATPVGIEQVYQCPRLCLGSSSFVSWNVPMRQSGAVGAWQPA